MKIFNTLSRKLEEFTPISMGNVQMFVCGPTVYDYIHIGNARTFVIFDTVARYLKYQGLDVNYIQNVTDIDDKIIQRAHDEKKTPDEISQQYTREFLKDIGQLNISSVTDYKLASQHIPEIIAQVSQLIEKGYAYAVPTVRAEGKDSIDPAGLPAQAGNQDVYFDLEKYKQDFPNQYGILSGQKTEDLETGVRVEMEANKRNPHDFVVWKAQNFSYDWATNSPWGRGRPGWHIEDTAISEKYLGQQYDIHGGGQDLKFPHHEAEIAQQQAASGKVPFVKYWMHSGFLINKSEKMSKSLGNFSTLREVLSSLTEHPAETLRFYFLSAHYRTPLAFEDKLITQAESAVDRIADFTAKLKKTSGSGVPEIDIALAASRSKFTASMGEDFNTPAAIASVFELIRAVNPYLSKNLLSLEQAGNIIAFLAESHVILGIIPPAKEQKIPIEILELAEQREKLREAKDWTGADKLRTQIESHGYLIDDTPFGPSLKAN